MYSRSESSIVIAPTSLLAVWMALMTLRHGNAVREQLRRVDVHLVLLLEAADGRDLGDAGHGRQRVAQIPVLQRRAARRGSAGPVVSSSAYW